MSTKVEQLLKAGAVNMANSLGQTGARPVPAPAAAPPGPDKYAGRTKGQGGDMLLAQIVPDPDQPRTEFDEVELDQLAASLKAHGQLQPIRVRWSNPVGKWVIVAGERRYRAALKAGLTKLACVFVETENPADVLLEEQLVENAIRADLKPIEQARAFRRLMDMKGYNGKQVAERLQLHPTTVTRTLQLLDLPAAVQTQVEEGKLAPSVATEIAKIHSPSEQVLVADRIVAEKLSRTKAVAAVAAKRAGTPKKAGKGRAARKDARESAGRKSFVFQERNCTVRVDFAEPVSNDQVRALFLELAAQMNAKVAVAA